MKKDFEPINLRSRSFPAERVFQSKSAREEDQNLSHPVLRRIAHIVRHLKQQKGSSHPK